MPDIAVDLCQDIYAAALQWHRLGRLDEAQAAYDQLRQWRPDAAESAHGPGLIALQKGDAARAVVWLRRAVVLAPAIPAYWSNLGLALERLKDWAAAIRAYRVLFALAPDAPAALCNLADMRRELGDIDAADRLYRMVLQRNPANVRALTNWGQMLKAVHRPEEALTPYRHLARLAPQSAAAHYDLGRALQGAALDVNADAEYRMAVACDPGHVEAWFHRARLLHSRQRHGDAVRAYRHCECLAPDRADIRHHIGLLALDRNRPGIALLAFRQAVILEPDHAEAWNGIGLSAYNIGRLNIAVPTLSRAVAVRSDFAVAHSNLGLAVLHLGEPHSAQTAFDTAASLSPDYPEIISNQLMCHQYLPGVTATALRVVHHEWQRHIAAPLAPPGPCSRPADPNRRLEIGLVSADFTCHPIGFFCKPLLATLDRREARLTWYAVKHYQGQIPDELRALAQAHGDRWIDADRQTADQLSARIIDDGIDILIDLAGHSAHNRLPVFARRPAPVQITWAGYVGTTGLSAMDWLIADRFHVPPGEDPAYGERILRLPGDYVCYAAPDYAPPVGPLPALASGFVTFGACHNPSKLNRPLLAWWRRVLDGVPNSRLLLKYKRLDDPLNQVRLYDGLGFGPDRVIIGGEQPHATLLATYNRIDIGLDSHPYSGGLTTLEALWMGVPVVTMTGASFAGRHSTSHLTHVGLGDLVTPDPEAYIARAIALATDLPTLAALRARLRPQMAASPVCDAPGYTTGFLAAMRHAWADWCRSRNHNPDRLVDRVLEDNP